MIEFLGWFFMSMIGAIIGSLITQAVLRGSK